MNRRKEYTGRYKLNAAELLQVLGYVRMYKQWLDEYNSLADMRQAIRYDTDKVQTSGDSDPLLDHVARMTKLSTRIGIIEQAAIEADCEIYQWILRELRDSVRISKMIKERELEGDSLPFSMSKYYYARRKFYYLVSLKIR